MSAAASISPAFVACPDCGFALPAEAFGRENETACPHCRATLSGGIFPAFWRSEPAVSGLAEHAADGDAVCFFHPENRAAVSCDRCGRFICAVCDMQLGVRHLCPTCLSSGLGAEKLPELVVRRFLWADTALLIGIVPLLFFIFFPAFIVTGPAAVFCAVFGWKRPGSLPRGRRHWAAVVGLIGGLVQLTIWVGWLLLITNSPVWMKTFR